MAASFCLHLMKREDFIEKNFPDIRAPFSVGIELTPYCNMRCIHCYGQNMRSSKVMTAAEIKRIIDILCENGMISVSFTGGEIFTRNDFEEIYIYAKEKGLIVSLLTNLTLLNEQHIEMFKEYPVSIISTTMYGYHEDVYESVTGIKGSYKKFIYAIELLKKNNILFELKYIAMRQNIQDLYDFRKYCKDLGVNSLVSFSIFPTTDNDNKPLEYRVTPEEVFDFDMNDEDRKRFFDQLAYEYYERSVGKRDKKVIDRQEAFYLYNCNISFRETFINSSGMMQGCVRTSYDTYDLLNGDFAEGWDYLNRQFRQKKSSKGFKCNKCEDLAFCEQCSAVFCRETGNPESVDDFFCKIAKLRKSYIIGKIEEYRKGEM